MAAPSPWIGPLLRSALDEYCSSGKQGTCYSSPDFAYSSEPRLFCIKLLNKQPRTLKVIELPGAQGTSEQLVTDGIHALPHKFARSNSCLPTQPDGQLSLSTGAVLTTEDVEFRISDYSDPPRSELHILSHHRIDNATLSQHAFTSKPLRLSQVEPIQQLLRYATGQNSGHSEMIEHGYSVVSPVPLSMEHNGHNRSRSEDDCSIASQAQFQTQAPFPGPEIAENEGHQDKQKQPVPLSTAQRVQVERAQDLLCPRANESRSEQAKIGPSFVFQASSDDHISRHPSVAEGDTAAANNQIASSVLSQQPIQELQSSPVSAFMPHPQIISSKQRLPGLPLSQDEIQEDETGRDKPSQDLLPPVPSMAASIQKRFQGLRVGMMVDRYLPRRITRMSKSQLALLNSNAAYYPPLAGQDFRPGTVPLDVLNGLTRLTDQLGLLPKDLVVPASANIETHQQAEGKGTAPEISTEENFAPPNSSQPGSDVTWSTSPSPASKRMGLPPDSPVKTSAEKNGSESETSSVAEEALINSDDRGNSLNRRTSAIRSKSEVQPNASQLQKASSSRSSTAQVFVDHDGSNCVRIDFPDIACTAHQIASAMQSAVQVKRTPYPGKGLPFDKPSAFTSSSPDNLSGSPNERILSTYDEVAVQQPINSNDGGSQLRAQIRPLMSDSNLRVSTATKRRASDEGPVTNNAKRPRFVSKGQCPDGIDPDYTKVIEASRARRTAELSLLARERVAQQGPNSASITSSTLHKDLETAAAASTPITIPSDPVAPVPAVKDSFRSKSRSSSARRVSEDTFRQYRSAYEDYKGDLTSFDHACNLIWRLREAKKGPHPSLFDDFIFHHYHSYRQYLQQVADSSDDPLPYAEFYDERIESPSHRSKIITLTVLGRPSSRLDNFRRESSNLGTRAESAVRSVDDSIGVHSSVSNQNHVQRHPLQEPVLESLRDEPADKMVIDDAKGEAPASQMNLSQRSSVKSWIERVREGSPELGSADIDHSQEIVPPVDLVVPHTISPSHTPAAPPGSSSTFLPPEGCTSAPTNHCNRKSLPSASPFASLKKREQNWWRQKDIDTPLNRWVQQFSEIPSVKAEIAATSTKPQKISSYAWR